MWIKMWCIKMWWIKMWWIKMWICYRRDVRPQSILPRRPTRPSMSLEEAWPVACCRDHPVDAWPFFFLSFVLVLIYCHLKKYIICFCGLMLVLCVVSAVVFTERMREG